MRKKPFDFKQERSLLISSILMHLNLIGYKVLVDNNPKSLDDLNNTTQIVIFKKYHPEKPLIVFNVDLLKNL